jgi:Tat protein translocase TatC
MVSLDDPRMREALDEPELPRMSFGDHLDELRSRLIKALGAIVLAVVALLPFHDGVQSIIIGPYKIQWRAGFLEHVDKLKLQAAEAAAKGEALDALTARYLKFSTENLQPILGGTMPYPHVIPYETGFPLPYSLFATGGLEDMMSFMWASLVFALVLASPVVIWQAWAFIAAGLYPKERAVFYRYFPFMMVLMIAGVSFGYFLALPYSIGFLMGLMNPQLVQAIFSIGQFITLEFALTGAMGLVFQLPLVMVALQRIGLVTHRAYRKHWRMTILIIFIVAAVVTPPEPVSMLLMSAPMLLLYGLGLVLTWLGRGRDAPVVAA